MKVITVCNYKGGTSKTTTTAHLAHAFAAVGKNVAIVDADPQGSMRRWAEQAGWEIPVIGLDSKTLHKRLPGILGNRFELVLIDTPPLDEQRGIVESAMRAADLIVVTMAPTMMEFERLPDVWESISYVNEDTNPMVVLTRTIANALSTGVYRDLLVNDGRAVATTEIPRREAIAQSFGEPITNLYGYDSIAAELGERLDTRP